MMLVQKTAPERQYFVHTGDEERVSDLIHSDTDFTQNITV